MQQDQVQTTSTAQHVMNGHDQGHISCSSCLEPELDGRVAPLYRRTHKHTHAHVGTHTAVAASGDQRRIGRAVSAVFCLLSSSSSSRDNCLSGLDDLKT